MTQMFLFCAILACLFAAATAVPFASGVSHGTRATVDARKHAPSRTSVVVTPMVWRRMNAGAQKEVDLQFAAAVTADGEITHERLSKYHPVTNSEMMDIVGVAEKAARTKPAASVQPTALLREEERSELVANQWSNIASIFKHNTGAITQKLAGNPGGSQFLGKFLIGSQKKEVNLILDTGSIFLWVKSTLCTSQKGCTRENVFDYADSSSFNTPNSMLDLKVTFGTGSLEGRLGKDVLCAGNDLCAPTPVALIQQMEGPDFAENETHGILGLALPQMESDEVHRHYGLPWLQNIIEHKKVHRSEIAFYLKKSEQRGAVIWGEPPDSLLQEGEQMHLYPVVDPYYWSMNLKAFYVGCCCISLSTGDHCNGDRFPSDQVAFQEMCLSQHCEENASFFQVDSSTRGQAKSRATESLQYLIADTGTTYNSLPDEAYERLSTLGLMTKTKDCRHVANTKYPFPNIRYVIAQSADSARTHILTPDDYLVEDKDNNCVAAFMKINTPAPHYPAALIGQMFIRSHVTSFKTVCKDGCEVCKDGCHATQDACCESFVGIGRSSQNVDVESIASLR